ncbi:hypothetical protein [Caulobacter sp. 17J65-9]|uniref:hypothetical protein n=1 Tax=Caulobacter sp. 17J65-9 TaxID=2709382 RepID=UPI0013C90D63|nr:hypothetical protein [Caulobacter sp. 17J65-9]NEX93547.1 hypothetical protein [Caulobacter sp. 17J65-9]
MLLGVYTDLRGVRTSMDLDAAVDFIGGVGARSGWLALVIYIPEQSAFIEVRDGSAPEAEQVSEQYLVENFAVSAAQIRAVKQAPAKWEFIDLRKRAA